MNRLNLSSAWFARLGEVDTPTVCNALELAAGRTTATGFTYGTPIAAPKPYPAMVGYARTARIQAAVPSNLDRQAATQFKLSYYRYVSSQDGEPVILLQEDVDVTPGVGSNWGEVNSAIHKALGVKGVVTNGSVRDLDMLAPDFPIIAGSVGPSHAHVHLVDFGTPVTVFGMRVNPSDLVHADRHGAVVIPDHLAPELPRFIDLTFAKEKPILEAARKPDFSIADIEEAFRQSAEIH